MENTSEVYETLPIVPLRDVVVFPHMMMPFVIGRHHHVREDDDVAQRNDRQGFVDFQACIQFR